VGETFANWGVPTAVSIMECRTSGPQIIGTGGIRTGLDAAKAIALGATVVGIARPLLNAALEGEDQVIAYLSDIITEIKLAMVLTGTRTISELRDRNPVTTGPVRQWIIQRGIG
jgi:isopentenyl-diphosphate delta-isomerase